MYSKLLFTALSIFFALTLCNAAETDAVPGRYQKLLVIYTNGDKTDQRMQHTLGTALETLKMNFTTVDADSEKAASEIDRMGSNDLIIVNSSSIPSFQVQSKLLRYVNEGGHLYFPFPDMSNPAMQTLAGIKETGSDIAISNIISCEKIFPGLENIAFGRDAAPIMFNQLKLTDTVQILQKSSDGIPVSWLHKFGKGSVICFNCTGIPDGSMSGILIQTMSLMNDYFMTTIFNAKVFFIDDFPSPVPLGTEYIVSNNYDGMSYDEFYKEVWWPQMQKLAETEKIKYTCLALGNYENSVKMPPFVFSSRMKDIFRYYGNEILKHNHELGIHGYNHASLLMSDYAAALKEIGYQPWKSEADMVTSLKCLRNALDETLGKRQYYSYVPPMNMLSKDGKKAVMEVFPEMTSFAGLGDATLKDPGVLYQDVGSDPDFPKVYALPRYSYGQVYRPELMAQVYSYIAYDGLFSHFIHPDELLDSERSENKDWKELYADLQKIMQSVNSKFPFLRPMSASEFVEERRRTAALKVYSSLENNTVTITYKNKSPSDPVYHYLRLNNGLKIKSAENAKFTEIAETEGLYLIEGSSSPVKISLIQQPAGEHKQ